MRFRSSTHRLSNHHGFSILEVLVTAAIIGVITAVLVFKYGSFNNAVLLKSQAYEIAQDLREAQIIAVSTLGSGGNIFREDYGLYFNSAAPNQYIVFRDSGDDVPALYDADQNEMIDVPRSIDSRFTIARICVNVTTSACDTPVDDISITFKRPNFDARFASGDTSAPNTIQNVRVELVNALDSNGATRSVVVSSTGQIAVE